MLRRAFGTPADVDAIVADLFIHTSRRTKDQALDTRRFARAHEARTGTPNYHDPFFFFLKPEGILRSAATPDTADELRVLCRLLLSRIPCTGREQTDALGAQSAN